VYGNHVLWWMTTRGPARPFPPPDGLDQGPAVAQGEAPGRLGPACPLACAPASPGPPEMTTPPSLSRYALLSIAAALLTIGLKAGAYLVSGSVGLLSDAYESGVNLVAAVVALIALGVASKPADKGHDFGHSKAEYFSSGVEGALIFVAAIAIVHASVPRLFAPQPIEGLGLGLGLSFAASLINFIVARVLLAASRRHQSITLEADAHHLMTDVWTSVGVAAGIGMVRLTGKLILDPIIAIGVALHILHTGWSLLRRSGSALLDAALPDDERDAIAAVLDRHTTPKGARWHALRTRSAGRQRFADVHVLVPGSWTVQQGHDLLEQIEGDLKTALEHLSITTHLEPLEDPRSDD